MRNLNKLATVAMVGLIILLSGCAAEPSVDGTIFVTDDGKVFELQHRIGDAYVAHRLDPEKLAAELKNIEKARAR